MSNRAESPLDLESLKKEAKRWLRSLRAQDPAALARLRQAIPDAPARPTLRDVQHALARERGFDGWSRLKSQARVPAAGGAALARDQALTALLHAAEDGDAARVRDLLDMHPDLVSERGLLPGHAGMRTALHLAVVGPHEDVVRLLLARGADPNVRDEGDWAYPLHFAAERGRLDLVRLLIEHGADPIGAGDYHELEVMGWATAFENVEPSPPLVDYLLAHGGRHTMASAVAIGDIEAIRRIAAASPGRLDTRLDLTNHRRTPLHLAVVKGQEAALQALLDLGSDPNALDEAMLTPLDQAVLTGRLAFARRLVDHGASVTFAAAVVLGRDDDIARWLSQDPQGLRPGHRWGTLIVRAAEYASGRVVEKLIELGASVDASDDTKTAVDQTAHYTALHGAAWRGNLDAVRVLLRHGANPRIRDDRYCSTPAGWAAYAGHTEARDVILGDAIDIFDAIAFDATGRIGDILARDPGALERPFGEYARCEPDGHWCTPLAAAAIQNKPEAVRLLLACGANRRIVAPDGRTLEELAAGTGRGEAARVLAAVEGP
jgi:ankyrin repeat protein